MWDWIAENTSILMLIAGILLAGMILLRGYWAYYHASREKPDRSTDRMRPSNPPLEMTQWQVEMHELARDLRGELATKLRLWQQLVAEAAAERERLEAVLAEIRRERASQAANERVGVDE